MVIELAIVIFSLSLFILYNIISLVRFKVPTSLSNTFYLWNNSYKHAGISFTAMMGSMGLSLLPAWLELGEIISPWSTNLNFLAFFACAAICFVGVAPAFKSNKLEGTVHTASAIAAAVASLVWCLVVCWQIMYVPILTAGLVAAVAAFSKTFKSSLIYWLEMMAFGATFITVIVELLMHL